MLPSSQRGEAGFAALSRWSQGLCRPPGIVGESPTKKQATHHASRLVPGRMATPPKGSFGPCSSRTRRSALDRTKLTRPEDHMKTNATLGLAALLLAAVAASSSAQQPA